MLFQRSAKSSRPLKSDVIKDGNQIAESWSKFRLDTGLLADLVGRNPIKLFVAFDRNYFGTIGVNGMVCTFSPQIETILLQISNKFTSLDRHVEPLWAVAQ